MGSCISKCSPEKKKSNKKHQLVDDDEYCSYVHDKLVVSQQPPLSVHYRKPVSPQSSAASTTTFSSVSCSSESSMASSSSCSSSSFSVSNRDRFFSNEFLRACAQENPQIIGRNLIQKSRHEIPGLQKKPGSSVLPIPENTSSTTPRKRARANSPTLVRQKSFRREPNSRTLMRSPSPSRRFNGKDSPVCSRRCDSNSTSVRKASSQSNYMSSPSMRRDNFTLRAPPSPNYYGVSRSGTMMMKAENELKGRNAGPRNSKNEIGEKEGLEAMVVEDIHNPLIALDCFIFL